MAPPIRVTLVGYGLSGASFHAPFLEALDAFEVVAVVTRDPARQALARARHPRARVVEDAGAVLTRDLCDLAVVAAPNRVHLPLAATALEAGLAVVVDKPVAGSAAEIRGLADLAAARDGLVVPFHNRRWDGDLMTLRRLLAQRELGRVHRFESRFERFTPTVAGGWRERGDPADAGGVLLDLGPHLVDQALLLFGPAERVYAELRTLRAGAQVADEAFVSIEHGGGVRSHLHMGSLTAHAGPRFRVLGDAAAFVKHGLDGQEAVLRGPEPGRGVAPDADAELHRGAGRPTAIPVDLGDYGAFYRGLAATLTAGAPPPVAIADAVAVGEVIDEALRQDTGRTKPSDEGIRHKT